MLYKIVKSDIKSIEWEVQQFISKGWRLYGDLIVTGNLIHSFEYGETSAQVAQALIKDE